MSSRVPMYGLLLLLLSASSACEATNVSGAAPTKLSSSASTASLSVEPTALRPEFFFDRSCSRTHPFGTRVIVSVRGEGAVTSMRFRFTDRFGTLAFPHVIVISGPDPLRVPVSSLGPVPMPTSMPIPTPGLAPLPSTSPVPIPSMASGQFPFFLAFDCGIAPDGVLVIVVDTNGPRGVLTSEIRARISE